MAGSRALRSVSGPASEQWRRPTAIRPRPGSLNAARGRGRPGAAARASGSEHGRGRTSQRRTRGRTTDAREPARAAGVKEQQNTGGRGWIIRFKRSTNRSSGRASFVPELQKAVHRVIVGQRYLIDRLLIGLLCDGHVLIEGVPGLAKTLAVKTLAKAIDTSFQRIQFTPDLLPADIVGTQMYDPRDHSFTVKKGPIFSNLILTDEINRAPAKVQSALLECMQERQVTIGRDTFKLEFPFLVMATQNPIEQEGTYPLPEAQVDRFIMKLKITYPQREEERLIMERVTGEGLPEIEPVITPDR